MLQPADVRFWEKPVKEIETAGGVLRVTFTMDPESDWPAQFLTLPLIRGADGKLLIKSSATAADLEAAKERKKKQVIKERNLQFPPEAGPSFTRTW
ncbi:MAG: hypothetical protein ACXW29_11895 [Thermoanaerobaculia bacterium]